MIRWEILATVTELQDPLGLFPDVRLGDPVRGMLKYDLTLWPNPLLSSTHVHHFSNDTWVDVARMIIENPRNGTELTFQADVDGDFADILVHNDLPGEQVPSDGVWAQQSVIAPAGFQGSTPVVITHVEGPASIFSHPAQFPTIDDRPPGSLRLDDWPRAVMVFVDAYGEDPSATGIAAEIYSMTLVTGPPLAGDFDYDGDVDEHDYEGWSFTFGYTGDWHYADSDASGVVDGADFLTWQRHVGSSSYVVGVGVPEPATLVTHGSAAVLGFLIRRRAVRGRGRSAIVKV